MAHPRSHHHNTLVTDTKLYHQLPSRPHLWAQLSLVPILHYCVCLPSKLIFSVASFVHSSLSLVPFISSTRQATTASFHAECNATWARLCRIFCGPPLPLSRLRREYLGVTPAIWLLLTLILHCCESRIPATFHPKCILFLLGQLPLRLKCVCVPLTIFFL